MQARRWHAREGNLKVLRSPWITGAMIVSACLALVGTFGPDGARLALTVCANLSLGASGLTIILKSRGSGAAVHLGVAITAGAMGGLAVEALRTTDMVPLLAAGIMLSITSVCSILYAGSLAWKSWRTF